MLFELLVCKFVAGALAAGVVAAVVAISFAAVKSWIQQNAISGETVELVRQNLDNAVVVRANIMSKHWLGERVRTTNSWKEKTLDQELSNVFAGRNKVRYKS